MGESILRELDKLARALGVDTGWGCSATSRRLTAPVAQLDRAPDYEFGGWRFESFRARQRMQSQLLVDRSLGSPIGLVL